MTMKMRLGIALAVFSMGSACAQEIVLRHQADGPTLDVLATQILRFNDSLQGKGKVILQDARGVEDRRILPHVALLDPADSMEFFGTRPRFLPLHQVMREAKQKFNTNLMYPQILDAVDDAGGKIQALPLGLALPVLLTNRAFLKRAGLDAQASPQTWQDLQKTAGAISESGVGCPLTSSRFSWVHVENISSQAGVPMVVRERRTERINANSLIAVKHLALLASWQKSHYFRYDGLALEGDERFLSGECAMLTGASSLYAAAVRAGIDVSISRLPYYDDVHGAKPADTLPDGISLWTLAGYKPNDYKLVARLVVYLMRPDVQQEWVRATSYLPMTPAAVAALRESGIPGNLLDAAEKRLSAPRKGSTRMKAGLLRDRLHEFLGEELPMVWDAGRPAKEALDATVSRLVALDPPPVVKAAKASPVVKASKK